MPKLVVNPSSPNRREISLSPGAALTIGRDPTNDIVLPDAMVSRRHAVVEPRAGLFYLRDCHSANGSVVNGERVSERGLRDGDVVAIGTARLVYRADLPDSASGKVVLHPSAVPLRCQACGADYRRGDVFCRECGAQVAQPSGPPKAVCAACGAAVALPARFCSGCGEQLAGSGDVETLGERTPRGLRSRSEVGGVDGDRGRARTPDPRSRGLAARGPPRSGPARARVGRRRPSPAAGWPPP